MPDNLLKTERQDRILRLIEESAQATVAELGRTFHVSEATVRRDLEELSQSGLLRRTHGGALRAVTAPHQIPVLQRSKEQADEKRRIGLAAAELIADGQTVFLGSGTTTVEVARAIAGKKRVTVITNAINIVNALAGDPNVPMIVLGGYFVPSELSMIGHFTEQALEELRADVAVMGALAVHPQYGVTNEHLPEMMTDRKIMQSASQAVIVADHTKLGRISTALLAPVTAVHVLVTDDEASAEILQELRNQGLRVIVA